MRNLRTLELKLSLSVSALGHAIIFSIISLRGDGLAPISQALMPGKETVLEIRLEQDEFPSGEAQLAPQEPHPTAPQSSGTPVADVPHPSPIADEPSERLEIVAVVRALSLDSLERPTVATALIPCAARAGEGSAHPPHSDGTPARRIGSGEGELSPDAHTVSLDRHRAAYLSNPKPAYPADARKRQQEGLVLLGIWLNAEGLPLNVALNESSGFPSLDEAAMQAAKAWRFAPAQVGGASVGSEIEVPIRFKLSE